MAVLDVWLYDRLAGRLEERSGGLAFRYDEHWVADRLPPISRSLPVSSDERAGELVHAFFSNLLPEGELRRLVARRFGVSAGNDFRLLAAIGGECAGAVSLTPAGEGPPDRGRDAVRWLDEHELAATVEELPRRPLLADPDEGIRLSLAGAQDKLPVVVRDGRVGIPVGHAASTHILKAPIERLDDTVVNEAFCLRLASALGLDVAAAEVRRAESTEFLLVERYDRVVRDAEVVRLHQEDACQALGVPPERKYESEGGPGLDAIAALLRDASDRPAPDLLRLVDAVAVNFLIGNHDAHGKNFSMLYDRDGTRFAPLYDLVCTAAYPGLSRKMAMKIGGEYRPAYVRRRHIERFAEEAGLGRAALRTRVHALALAAPEAASSLARALEAQGLARPVLDRMLQLIRSRAHELAAETARAA